MGTGASISVLNLAFSGDATHAQTRERGIGRGWSSAPPPPPRGLGAPPTPRARPVAQSRQKAGLLALQHPAPPRVAVRDPEGGPPPQPSQSPAD